MSSHSKNVNVERRTWDRSKYEARAAARTTPTATADQPDRGEQHPPQDEGSTRQEEEKEEFQPAAKGRAGPEKSRRAYLKSRLQRVDLTQKLGTTEFVAPPPPPASKTAASSGSGAELLLQEHDNQHPFQNIKTKSNTTTTTKEIKITDGISKITTHGDGIGWHCQVCQCYLKDSLTYLDHINGRKHQRALGYTMRIEQVSVANVRAKMELMAEQINYKKKHEERMQQQDEAEVDENGIHTINISSATNNNNNKDRKRKATLSLKHYQDIILEKEKEEQERNKERARRRVERRKRVNNQEQQQQQQQQQHQAKLQKNTLEEEIVVVENRSEKEILNNENQEEGEEEEEELDDCGIDPNIAAMMGFASFGTTNQSR